MNAEQNRVAIDEAYDLADAVVDHLRRGDGHAASETFDRFKVKFNALGEMLDYSSIELGDTDFGDYDGSFAYCYLNAASVPMRGIDRSRDTLHKVMRRLHQERWRLIRDHCAAASDPGEYVRMSKNEVSAKTDRTFRTLKKWAENGKFRMTEIEGTRDVWVHRDDLQGDP